MTAVHKLVIVGGGVAGLDVASHLAGATSGKWKLAVTLVDQETAYVWKPMLHTIAAGTSDAGMQQTIYAAQARARGFDFQFGRAVAIDRGAREVRLAAVQADGEEVLPQRSLSYDSLILAVGSGANDFGTDGVAEHCARIDTRADALAFNDRLRIEMLRRAVTGDMLRIGIVGGGATGVELAAELVQLASIAEQYGVTDASRRLSVTLIEAGPHLLATFPESISLKVEKKLEGLGVTVRTATRVASVHSDGFLLKGGGAIEANLMVWAAGVKAPELLNSLSDLPRSQTGQLIVDENLRCTGDKRIFALGDCSSAKLPGLDKPPPTTAQAASQEARWMCRNLPRLIAGGKAQPMRYHDFGSLVSLGGYDAFGALGRFGFLDGFIRGRIAQFGHAMLYRAFQVRLHGAVKGSLLWIVDTLSRRVRPTERLS